ncbi:uncharacterized protein LOC108028936 [Drosophila biarmipes]|uniref:uncharacterized protein LOC108028936 n=1 Tax=Drosophila biarmipes TaxID=125945 RepID=UPI0007E6DD33|nr:uncharacterized protein LOC108028936 [Drosophila biarmipes]
MLNLSRCFLPSVVLLNLFGSPFSSAQDPGSVCVLSNAPQQCGAFCLSALEPLFGRVERIEAHLEQLLIKVDALNDAPMGNEEALRGMEASESKLLSELAVIRKVVSRIDGRTVPLGFERIGSRYFYIEETQQLTWRTAKLTCRRLGGHLAAVKDQEELEKISARLKYNTYYWLGLYEPAARRHFSSVASNKTDPFTNWRSPEPSYEDETSPHCVLLISGLMHAEDLTDTASKSQLRGFVTFTRGSAEPETTRESADC